MGTIRNRNDMDLTEAIIFSERSRNRTCPGQKAPEKLPHTSHSIFMDQHLRAGVCVCVCVCVARAYVCGRVIIHR